MIDGIIAEKDLESIRKGTEIGCGETTRPRQHKNFKLGFIVNVWRDLIQKKRETYILPLFYKKQIFDDPYLKLFKALSILERRTLTSSRAISGEVILSRSKAKVLSNSSVTFPAEASISGKRGVDKEL